MKEVRLDIGTYWVEKNTNEDGVNVYTNEGEKIGMALLLLPDQSNRKEVLKFMSDLTDWIVDNEIL